MMPVVLSGPRRMAQTLEGNVPELSAVRSKCDHIHAENEWELADSSTNHCSDLLLEEAECTGGGPLLLRYPHQEFPVARSARTNLTRSGQQVALAPSAPTDSPRKPCALDGSSLWVAPANDIADLGIHLTICELFWQRGCLPTNSTLRPP